VTQSIYHELVQLHPEWEHPDDDKGAIARDSLAPAMLREYNVAADDIAIEDDALAGALASDRVQAWVKGKEPRRVIYVPGKLLNIVV